jgi:hypothetical protein
MKFVALLFATLLILFALVAPPTVLVLLFLGLLTDSIVQTHGPFIAGMAALFAAGLAGAATWANLANALSVAFEARRKEQEKQSRDLRQLGKMLAVEIQSIVEEIGQPSVRPVLQSTLDGVKQALALRPGQGGTVIEIPFRSATINPQLSPVYLASTVSISGLPDNLPHQVARFYADYSGLAFELEGMRRGTEAKTFSPVDANDGLTSVLAKIDEILRSGPQLIAALQSFDSN